MRSFLSAYSIPDLPRTDHRYNPDSATAVIVAGVLDSLSSGILL